MHLALKNIVVNLSQSLSSHCFTATLWVDGQAAFDVQDQGFGEPMLYKSLPNNKVQLRALLQYSQATVTSPASAPISATVASKRHYQHLDQALTAMVDEHLATLKTEHQLRRITFEHQQRLYELSPSRHGDELAVARLKQSPWWTNNHILVNDLPLDKASALLQSYQFKVSAYTWNEGHAPQS